MQKKKDAKEKKTQKKKDAKEKRHKRKMTKKEKRRMMTFNESRHEAEARIMRPAYIIEIPNFKLRPNFTYSNFEPFQTLHFLPKT